MCATCIMLRGTGRVNDLRCQHWYFWNCGVISNVALIETVNFASQGQAVGAGGRWRGVHCTLLILDSQELALISAGEMLGVLFVPFGAAIAVNIKRSGDCLTDVNVDKTNGKSRLDSPIGVRTIAERCGSVKRR